MKEKIAVILCLLTLSLPILALAVPARAIDGRPPYGWVEPSFVGYDPYYDESIIGYVERTNWNLTMTWTNFVWPPVSINVSAIRLSFDWGKNYSYSFETPIQVDHEMSHTFTVYNVTPSISEAPELWTHSYTIWIDNVNSTTPPYRELSPIEFWSGSGFAVLSADHFESLKLWSKYMMFLGPMAVQAQMVTPFEFFPNVTEAQVLFVQASFEFSQGFQFYMAGVFGSARDHLEAGDALITQALDVWNAKGTDMESADLGYKNAQASYYNGQGAYYTALGEASKTNAYGWVLFGLGWVFIGIGVIVYGYRKPKAPQPPT